MSMNGLPSATNIRDRAEETLAGAKRALGDVRIDLAGAAPAIPADRWERREPWPPALLTVVLAAIVIGMVAVIAATRARTAAAVRAASQDQEDLDRAMGEGMGTAPGARRGALDAVPHT
jgi:hypothetical protein